MKKKIFYWMMAAILYMFYLSQKDMPLAVQHPEIPLD